MSGFVTRVAAAAAEPTAPPSGGTAAVVVLALAAGVAIATVALQDRLSSNQVRTLLSTSLLMGFFAIWTALIAQPARPILGVVLFVASVGLFRIMGRFERPPDVEPPNDP
jgi:uncharacterized membrane protein